MDKLHPMAPRERYAVEATSKGSHLMMRLFGVLLPFFFAMPIAGCESIASTAAGSPPPAARNLPVGIQGGELGYYAESRQLTSRSTAVTVNLVARTSLANVAVTMIPDDAALSVTPAACRFGVLRPPHMAHATRPPYPLPAVPICTFVVTAPSPGRYPSTLQVRDAKGNDVLTPVKVIVVIKGD